MTIEQELAAAWQLVDERTAALQRRSKEIGDIPLYDDDPRPLPASDGQLLHLKKLFEKAYGMPVPIELIYSLKRWNGRWIAHDHVIDFFSVEQHVQSLSMDQIQEKFVHLTQSARMQRIQNAFADLAQSTSMSLLQGRVADLIKMNLFQEEPAQEESADPDPIFEQVIGPINPIMESRKRFCFGGHEGSGSFLYLDYEDPPEGGRLGQVIRMGEDPTAEYVAGSFVEFLNLIARAPVYDDNPDLDPLEWHP